MPPKKATVESNEEEGYCVKCRKKEKMVNVEEKQSANGRWMHQGKCSECETKMTKFIAKKD